MNIHWNFISLASTTCGYKN